ncbi:MAG: hypothetical protein IT244_08665 [Bacteroidia bacterium]|nr:hypothetical protein [Bacteroidia bacterium]
MKIINYNVHRKEAQRAVARRFGEVVAGELNFTQMNTELALRQFGSEAVKFKRARAASKRLAFWLHLFG